MANSLEMAARSARRRRIAAVLGAAATIVVLGVLLMAPASGLAADDPKAAAAQLSDQAFALLGSIGSGTDASKALLGPVAGFAGDAQSLSSALSSGNHSAAAQAMAELLSDRDAVDAAAKAHPGLLDGAKWEALKRQLDTLAKAVRPSAVSGGASATAGSAPAIDERGKAGPKVKIESLAIDPDDVTHVKGFLEGRDLESAGVFSGAREIRAFDLGSSRRSLRVEFDIQLAQLEPGTVIRVYDKSGRSAEAPIAPPAEPIGAAGSSGGVIVNRGTEAAPEDESSEVGSSSTAEIPSTEPSSPSKRHIRSHLNGGAALTDVQIQITNTALVDPTLHEYQVVGQISGKAVQRAAIFVDGRMAQQIALTAPDGFGNRGFNQMFVMNGLQATIRVYGTGDQYVESSIRTPGPVVPGPIVIPGYGVNPYAYGVGPYGMPPYGPGVNPYGVNPYGMTVNPYGNANPGYNGYNIYSNGSVAPGYNPYGYPYPNPPPKTKWWQQVLP